MRRKPVFIAGVVALAVLVAAAGWQYAQVWRVDSMLRHVASLKGGAAAEAEAARIAKYLNSAADIRRLISRLGDQDQGTWEAVITVLAHIGAPAVRPVADRAKTLHNWRAPVKRGKVAELLGGILWDRPPHWSVDLSPVGPIDQNDRNDRLFMAYCLVLSHLGDPAVDELLSMAKADDETTRILGVASLAMMAEQAEHGGLIEGFYYSADEHDAQLAAVFVEALKDPNPMMRSSGAYGLGHVRNQFASQTLLAALGDKHTLVTKYASVALVRFYRGDADVVDRLISTLADPSTALETRAWVADSLGNIDEARVREALFKALSDPDDRLRNQAANSLASRRDDGAISAAIAALGAADKNLRDGARRFLSVSAWKYDGTIAALVAAYDGANDRARATILNILTQVSGITSSKGSAEANEALEAIHKKYGAAGDQREAASSPGAASGAGAPPGIESTGASAPRRPVDMDSTEARS